MDTENNPHHSAASEAVVLHSPSSESGPTSSTESIRHTRDNDGFFKPLPVIKRSPHSRLSLPNIPLRSAKSAQSPYHHSLTSPRGSNIPVPSFRSTGIKSKRESNPSQPTPGTPCKRNPQNLFLSRHPPSRPQSEPQPRLHPHSFRNVVPPSPFGKSKSSDSIQTISLTPKDDDSPSSRVQFNSSNRSSRISSFNNSLQSSPIRNHPASGASAKLPFKRSKSFGSPKSLASNFPTSLVPLSSSRTNPNDESGMDMPKEDCNDNDESDENSNLSPPAFVPPSPVSFPIQFKAPTKVPMFGVRPYKQRPVKAHHLDRKYFLENSSLALNEDLSDTDPPDYFETTYTVLDTIGSGSFADVYRVRHIATGIEYALKATKKAYTGARDR
ncbi:hypothetical protein BKA69DRAFT_938038 [Paraphysoderma sedebokerense]|nr:hypothetical protein BKA69DRAFT_938038 [Paraphysoderma sedebokerense]